MTYSMTIARADGTTRRMTAYDRSEMRELAVMFAGSVVSVYDEHGRAVAACRLCGVPACRNHAQA